MIGYVIGLIGMWIVSDGIYSWTLYVNAPSYDGKLKQSFGHDHWVRLIRILLGVVLVINGGLLVLWSIKIV